MKTRHMIFEGKFVDDPQNHTLKMQLATNEEEPNIKQGEKYLIELKRKVGYAEIHDEYIFVKRLRKSGSSYEFSVPRAVKENIAKDKGYMVEIKGPIKYYDTGWNRVIVKL